MNKFIKQIIAGFIAMFFVASTVAADSGFYGEAMAGGVQTYKTGEMEWFNDNEYNTNEPLVGVGVGYYFVDDSKFSFSIEGRVLSTFNADETDTTIYGAYFKPGVYFTDNLEAYALLGGSYVRRNVGGESVDKKALSPGVGVSYKFNKNVAVFCDYTWNLLDTEVEGTDDVNVDTLIGGVSFKF